MSKGLGAIVIRLVGGCSWIGEAPSKFINTVSKLTGQIRRENNGLVMDLRELRWEPEAWTRCTDNGTYIVAEGGI